jgi:hypothetical protein
MGAREKPGAGSLTPIAPGSTVRMVMVSSSLSSPSLARKVI